MNKQSVKIIFDPGTLTLKNDRIGVQLYCPIISLKEGVMKLSFSTVVVISKKTWQYNWAGGFQILGFGFGVAKYKEKL